MSRLILLLFFFAAGVSAIDTQSDGGLLPIPEQPDVPSPVESGENMEPDVTIIRRGKDLIEEYRINNRLYMVKIKPSIGPSYYLVDTDGDGNMDVRRSEAEKQIQVPQWVLFSW
jgi:hypothetical protein